MARKKKIQIEKHPGRARGTEHLPQEQILPGLPGARLTPEGREIPSNEPIVLHLKRRTVTDLETLRAQIQAIRATDGPVEFETFQEADDFDIEDSFGEFTSRWELQADNDTDDRAPTAAEFVRFQQTGELPARWFKTAPQDGNGGSRGAPEGGASGAQPQPSPNAGIPAENPVAPTSGKQ